MDDAVRQRRVIKMDGGLGDRDGAIQLPGYLLHENILYFYVIVAVVVVVVVVM